MPVLLHERITAEFLEKPKHSLQVYNFVTIPFRGVSAGVKRPHCLLCMLYTVNLTWFLLFEYYDVVPHTITVSGF